MKRNRMLTAVTSAVLLLAMATLTACSTNSGPPATNTSGTIPAASSEVLTMLDEAKTNTRDNFYVRTRVFTRKLPDGRVITCMSYIDSSVPSSPALSCDWNSIAR